MPFGPEPATLWTLSRDGKTASAIAQFNPLGTEIRILRDGSLLYSRILPWGEDALAWAEEERVQLVEEHWTAEGS